MADAQQHVCQQHVRLPGLPCSNPVNSTVPIAAEVLKKAGVYDKRKVRSSGWTWVSRPVM